MHPRRASIPSCMVLPSLLVLSLTLTADCLFAGGLLGRRDRPNIDAPVPPLVMRSRDRASPPPAPPPKSYDRSRYPKFIGGFHSRELQNVGVPPGDVGLRGNGFSMFPW